MPMDRFPCDEINRAVTSLKQRGRRPTRVTLGRRLLNDFLENLAVEYKFTNLVHVTLFNAVQANRAEEWLRRRRFVTYRGIPLRIVDGDQLTVE